MSLLRRIRRLEDQAKPVAPSAPCVIDVLRGETHDQAISRYVALFPNLRGNLLIVPKRDETAEDEAAFAIGFKAQQLQSLATAKSPPQSREVV